MTPSTLRVAQDWHSIKAGDPCSNIVHSTAHDGGANTMSADAPRPPGKAFASSKGRTSGNKSHMGKITKGTSTRATFNTKCWVLLTFTWCFLGMLRTAFITLLKSLASTTICRGFRFVKPWVLKYSKTCGRWSRWTNTFGPVSDWHSKPAFDKARLQAVKFGSSWRHSLKAAGDLPTSMIRKHWRSRASAPKGFVSNSKSSHSVTNLSRTSFSCDIVPACCAQLTGSKHEPTWLKTS